MKGIQIVWFRKNYIGTKAKQFVPSTVQLSSISVVLCMKKSLKKYKINFVILFFILIFTSQ